MAAFVSDPEEITTREKLLTDWRVYGNHGQSAKGDLDSDCAWTLASPNSSFCPAGITLQPAVGNKWHDYVRMYTNTPNVNVTDVRMRGKIVTGKQGFHTTSWSSVWNGPGSSSYLCGAV